MFRRILLAMFAFAIASGDSACAQTFRPGSPISDTNPQPVKPLCWDGTQYQTCSSSGGGGGSGDASAANQVALNNAIGAISSSPTANTVQDRLRVINVTLGNPFQAGGSIGNTSFGISGSLPAGTNAIGSITNTGFAITGSLPTGSNTIGSIANTSFAATQSGTWNIGNVTGTVSLPSGASTAANQTSVIGTKAAGTAATNSMLGGVVFNTSLPTLTTGQQAAMQADSSGRLIVNCGAGCSAGTAQGATSSGVTGSLTLGNVTTAAPTYTTATSNALSLNTAGALRVDTGAAATSLSTLAATTGTTGTLAPSTALLVSGVNPAGNSKGVATDTGGRLLPGQGVVTTSRTTLTASTATALEAAGVSARVGTNIFIESTLSANVYICSTQTTSCSATAYDFLIPSGATPGTMYTPMFGTTGRFYAYSTGTPVVVINSWSAQ